MVDKYLDILKELPYARGLEMFYQVDKADNLLDMHYKNERIVNEKIVVYTGVFGEYDGLVEPLWNGDNIDYYYIVFSFK